MQEKIMKKCWNESLEAARVPRGGLRPRRRPESSDPARVPADSPYIDEDKDKDKIKIEKKRAEKPS